MSGRPKVALLIESSNTYARELLHGIRSWQRDHDTWTIRLTEHGRGAKVPAWLKSWEGDGIIARVENRGIAKALQSTGFPVVDVSAALPDTPFIRVATDSAAATELAIDHLRERGLTQFAYCGDDQFQWSKQRYRYFADGLKERGYACAKFSSPKIDRKSPRRVDQEVDAIAQWLMTLPKPVGILACYDIRGQQVLEACGQVGIRVPDEAAVMGVHNDELLCDLCDPPLSSVIPNARQAGYRAAEILSQLMVRKSKSASLKTNYLIEPLGVSCRQSTDLVAIDDPKISEALRFIRDHADEGITVADVLKAVPMSRTLLERRFKDSLGTTPHRQILHIRLSKVKTLLTTTKLSISEIADRCGFDYMEYLCVAFKRESGQTPSDFRKANSASMS